MDEDSGDIVFLNEDGTTEKARIFTSGDNENPCLYISLYNRTYNLILEKDKLKLNGNTLYHTGNKPTPSDIGASVKDHTHLGFIGSRQPLEIQEWIDFHFLNSEKDYDGRLFLAQDGFRVVSPNGGGKLYHEGFKPSLESILYKNTITSSTRDWNTITETGIYTVHIGPSGSGILNFPQGAYGYGLLEVYYNHYVLLQRYTPHAKGDTYFRCHWQGDGSNKTWPQWVKLGNGNLLRQDILNQDLKLLEQDLKIMSIEKILNKDITTLEIDKTNDNSYNLLIRIIDNNNFYSKDNNNYSKDRILNIINTYFDNQKIDKKQKNNLIELINSK